MTRLIAPIVRRVPLGKLDEDAERRAYWRQQPPAAIIAEIESLRRLWTGLAGDPDLPIARVVHKRYLRDAPPPPPAKTR